MRKASGAYQGGLPKSLNARLALLQWGIQPVPPPKARAGVQGWRGKAGGRLIGFGFSLGLACSGALGCSALLVHLFASPGLTPVLQTSALPDAGPPLAAPQSGWREQQARNDANAPLMSSFDLTLRRGYDGKASLPLRITGTDRAETVRVTLRNVPATAWLSGGERQDDHTWALRAAELEGLRMTLGEGTPLAFDMTIEVASQATGTRLAGAVAHVRLSDRTAQAIADDRGSAAATRPLAVDTPFRTEVTAVPLDEPVRAAQARPPLPDGMSTLGGPTGGPMPPPEQRAVWWKLPASSAPPAWTPFANGISGN